MFKTTDVDTAPEVLIDLGRKPGGIMERKGEKNKRQLMM